MRVMQRAGASHVGGILALLVATLTVSSSAASIIQVPEDSANTVVCEAESEVFLQLSSQIVCAQDAYANVLNTTSSLQQACPASLPDENPAFVITAFRSLPTPCFNIKLTSIEQCASADEPATIRFVVRPPDWQEEVCIQRVVPGVGALVGINSAEICDCAGVELLQDNENATKPEVYDMTA